MAATERSRGPQVGIAAAVAVTVLGLALLYLVVRSALVSVNPVAAAHLPPRQHSGLLRLRLNESLAPQTQASSDLVALARATALAEPLSFAPFFVQARAAEQAGQLPLAIRLMEEARKRRANFVPTRFQLAAYYTSTGRLKEGLGELSVALRLVPQAVEPVMVELSKLLLSQSGRRVLAEALVGQPSWRTQFFTVARTQPVSPEQALGLLQEVRARSSDGDNRLERQLYITSLINSGRVRQARQVWLNLLPEAERERHRLISNSRFVGRSAGEPFGWQFHDIAAGRAEIRGGNTSRPYLSVDFFGGSSAMLAEQLLALPAGSYSFRYDAAGENGLSSSSLFWSIVCFSGSSELLRSEIARLSPDWLPTQASFEIPQSGCEGQRLRLMTAATDLPQTGSVRLAGVEITR